MEDDSDMKKRRAWFPYVVSALGDNTGYLKNADSVVHILAWILLLVVESFAFMNVQNHIQYMKDSHAEMENRLSLQNIESTVADIAGGSIGGDGMSLNGDQITKMIKYASTLLTGHGQKTDLHGWALEQTGEAAFMGVIVAFVVVVIAIMLHFSTGGVVPGGLPAVVTSIVPAGLRSSVLFTILSRLVICMDWLTDYTMRHTAQSDMFFNFLQATLFPPNDVLRFRTAAEMNKNRDTFWIFAIVLKLYLSAIFITNIRAINRQSHSAL
jgi:hypothetical protein